MLKRIAIAWTRLWGARSLIAVAFLVLVGLALAGSPAVDSVERGLDPSWRVAIQWWRCFDYSWGRDLNFTYGPLGFVNAPVAVGPPIYLRLAVLLRLCIPVAVVLICAYIFQRLFYARSLGIAMALLLSMLVFAHDLPYKWLFSLAPMLAALLILRKEQGYRWAILLALNAAFLLLSIPGSGLIAVMILLFVSGVLLLQQRWRIALIGLSAFAFFFGGGWCLFAGPNPDLPRYLLGAWHFAQGYGAAMARPYRFWYDTFPVLHLAFWVATVGAALVLYCLWHRAWNTLAALLVAGLYAFAVWKHAIARHPQAIVYLYVSLALVLAIWTHHASKERRGRRRALSVGFFLVIMSCCSGVETVIRHGSVKELPVAMGSLITSDFPKALTSLNPSDSLHGLCAETTLPQPPSPIPQTQRDIIAKASVDSYPWDISDLFLADLAWRPRPVIQSYCTWTSLLDQWNATHIKEQGPEFILFNAHAMDRRYRFTNEPISLQAMRRHYRVVSLEEDSLLLERRVLGKAKAPSEILASKELSYGAWIDIPVGEALYAIPHLKKSWWGSLVSLFYKDIGMNLAFELEDGSVHHYRAVSDNLKSGVYVGHLLNDTAAFADWFQGEEVLKTRPRIRKMKISPWFPSYYPEKFTLVFQMRTETQGFLSRKDAEQAGMQRR